ncbi:unnamed protein product, partial [Polarella glacialis]
VPLGESQEPASAEASEVSAAQGDHVLVSYRSKRLSVPLPVPNAGDSARSRDSAVTMFLEPFCAFFPEDADYLRDAGRCVLRDLATGECFAVAEAAERALQGVQEMVVCPGSVSRHRGSVVRSVLKEVVDFLVSTSFGAASEALDSGTASEEPQTRNTSVAPQSMRLQGVLLEILLLLAAVVAPRYAPAA